MNVFVSWLAHAFWCFWLIVARSRNVRRNDGVSCVASADAGVASPIAGVPCCLGDPDKAVGDVPALFGERTVVSDILL